MYLEEITTEHFAMPNTKRHDNLLSEIDYNLNSFRKNNKCLLSRESVSLAHYGSDISQHEYSMLELIDIEAIADIDYFRARVLNDLYVVEPDIMLFTTNKFIENVTETRVVGFPNLIVEVWSDSNKPFGKQKKFDIYKTGFGTEHWYMEQNSNVIRCFFEKKELKEQYLTNILRTVENIEIDLRAFAI